MKRFASVFIALLIIMTTNAQKDRKYYELRTYYSHPGKLEDLIKRFQDHTTRIFEKHGMENIGYWVPTDNKENALHYVLAYPDKKSRDASWKNFMNDGEWKSVSSKSEENGKLVQKITSVFMQAADISPKILPSGSDEPRSFELRTYTCYPGQLPKLLARFRDHTRTLFEKHGMTNIAYWTTLEDGDQQPKLVYIMAYPSEEKGKKSWEDFRSDPEWIKAKSASEKDAKIVETVESVYMTPLSFSSIR